MMRFDFVARQILKRRFLAWLRSIFGPKPFPIPRVIVPVRVWSDADERREEALYLAAPSAFWLRPDRDLHSIPCWQIEGEYVRKEHLNSKVNPAIFGKVQPSSFLDVFAPTSVVLAQQYAGQKAMAAQAKALDNALANRVSRPTSLLHTIRLPY